MFKHFEALPCGLSQQKIASYSVFSPRLWKILIFFNIDSSVPYKTLLEINWWML